MADIEPKQPSPAIEINFELISADALQGVVDDFILREGTDYGQNEVQLETKRIQILRQLKVGKIKLVYDPESESITLLSLDEWRRRP